jgi:hypothetical protein
MAIGPGFVPAQLPTGQEYFKLPFNELLAGLSAKQDKFDKAKAADNLEKLIPEGGLRTQELRQGILSELETDVAPLREKLYKTGQVSPYEFEAIGKKYANDQRINFLKQDVNIMPEANKLILDPKFQYGIHPWHKNGNISQLKWQNGQVYDPSTGQTISAIGDAYKYVAPADIAAGMNKEFNRALKENFKEIPPESEITSYYNPTNGKTEYRYTTKEGTGLTIKSLTEDEVRAKLETPALGGYSPLDALVDSNPASEYGPFLIASLEQQGIKYGTPEFKEAYKERFYGANKGLMYKYINYNTTASNLASGKVGGEDVEYKIPSTLGTNIPGVLLTNDMKDLKGNVIQNSGDFITFAQTPLEEVKTQFKTSGDNLLKASGLDQQGIYSDVIVDDTTGNYITIFKDADGKQVDITQMVLNKPIAEQIEFKRLVQETATEQQALQSNQEAAQHLINYYKEYSKYEDPNVIDYNKIKSKAADEIIGFVGNITYDLQDPSKFNEELLEKAIDQKLLNQNFKTQEEKEKAKKTLKKQIENKTLEGLKTLNPEAEKFYKEIDNHLQGAAFGNIDAVPLITSNSTMNKSIETTLLNALKSEEFLSNVTFANKKGTLKEDKDTRDAIVKHFTEASALKNPDDSKILQNALLRYDYNRPGKPLVIQYNFDGKTSIELPVEDLFKGQNTEFLNELENSLINKDRTIFNTTVNNQLQKTGGLFFKLPTSNYGAVFISPETITGAGYKISEGTRVMASEKLPGVLITNTSQENFKYIDDFIQRRKAEGKTDEEINSGLMNFLQKPELAQLGFQVITQPGVYKYFNKIPKVNFQ